VRDEANVAFAECEQSKPKVREAAMKRAPVRGSDSPRAQGPPGGGLLGIPLGWVGVVGLQVGFYFPCFGMWCSKSGATYKTNGTRRVSGPL